MSCPERCDGSAPFAPPELPGFTATIGQSDFLDAICLPRLFSSSGILDAGNCPDAKNVEDLPGYRDDMM